jgi:hypothetical protein
MVEQAKYTVMRNLGKVEIRKYPSIVVARVQDHRDNAFGILFKFISGNNRQKAKVAMTAPVISERIKMTAPVLSDGESLAFVMPESYTLDTTPEPADERIKVVEIPGRYLAVLRFSGRWSDSVFEARTRELLDELEGTEIKTRGSTFSMLYNAPYTPWFMRRNEVAIEVEVAEGLAEDGS